MKTTLNTDCKAFNTPILLLAFNRPEKTKEVFEMIRKVKPTKLYVAVDAPRDGRQDDVEKSKQVKEIVQNVDWPCETHYLFQEKNLGCSLSGVTAWNWIFQKEDRMLFIEDDGLATISAFYFVQEMLERYKDDNRIAYVGAVNYGPKFGESTYFFSRYPSATYFMGTWKRVWKLYEYDIESYEQTKYLPSFRSAFRSTPEYMVSKGLFDGYVRSIKQHRRYNTYDVQMTYLSYKYDMYSIYPNVNMVSNIGLDGGANNHVNENSTFYFEYANRPKFEISEITHPLTVSVNNDFEKSFYNKRILYNRSWILVWGKAWLLNHFGSFYKKWIRPIRRGF